MPQLNPTPSNYNERLRAKSVESITDAFHRGYLTAGQYNQILRAKAHAEIEGAIGDKGYFPAIAEETVKEVQKGWDNLKEAASHTPSGNIVTGEKPKPGSTEKPQNSELYYLGLAVWGQIQMLSSVFTAVGNVTGEQAELYALKAGASPGLARTINIGVNVATGFVPVGGAAQGFVRGVQKLSGVTTAKTVGKVAQEAVAGAKAAEAGAKAAGATEHEVAAAQALAEGLHVDGVPDAAKVVGAAHEAAGVTLPKGILKDTGEADKTFYHGTGNAFHSFDISKSRSGAYGKGIYITDNPEIASGYAEDYLTYLRKKIADKDVTLKDKKTYQSLLDSAEKTGTEGGAANVRPVKLSIRNPFEIDKTYDVRELPEPLASALTPKKVQSEKNYMMTGQDIYDGIGGTEEEANQFLRQAGFDSIKYPGGKITGGVKHQAYNVFDPQGLRPAFEKATPLSVAEQFQSDLAKFKAEMEKVTTPQTMADTMKKAQKWADDMGLSVEDIKAINPGQPMNEVMMAAYLKAVEPQADGMLLLAERFKQDPSEANMRALVYHFSEFSQTAPTFRGMEATAGRTVQILNQDPRMQAITDLITNWSDKSAEAMATGDIKGGMAVLADDLLAAAEQGKDKAAALLIQQQAGATQHGAEWWGMAKEAYRSLLLARPLTRAKEMMGRSFMAANEIMDRTVGGLFSIDKATGLIPSEGAYLAKGMLFAQADGLTAFGRAFTQHTPEQMAAYDMIAPQIPGITGRLIRGMGIDQAVAFNDYFAAIMSKGSYYAQAMREGVHRGLEGDALTTFVNTRVNMPTQAMIATGKDLAERTNFMNALGPLGQSIQKVAQYGPLITYFPFMKVPTNLAKAIWNRTPGLQLMSSSLYADILAGGPRADLAIGRLTNSTLQASFLFQLANEGLITGSGPANEHLRTEWMRQHPAYSLKVGDGWMPLTNIEPGTGVLGQVADFAQIMNQLEEPDAEQGAMAVAFSVMRNMADKTYWTTLSHVIDLTSSIKTGKNLTPQMRDTLLSPVTATATVGPLVAAVAKARDPISREARSYLDTLTAKVPGYSLTLPPRRDGYGDPILPPQAVGGPWIGIASPLKYQPTEHDPVKTEGDRLQAVTPHFPWTVGGNVKEGFDINQPMPEDRLGVELTPEQRDRWQQHYRTLIRHPSVGIEAQLLHKEEYQNMTPAAQREAFSGYLLDMQKTALDGLLLEDPHLQESIMQSDANRVKPLLPPRAQDQLQQQTNEAISQYDTLSPQERENLMRFDMLGPDTEGVAP